MSRRIDPKVPQANPKPNQANNRNALELRVGDPYPWDEVEAHVRVPDMVLTDPKLTPAAKLLFGVIRSSQYRKGLCYAAVRTLAARVRLSDRQCQRSIQKLVAAGWVRYESRTGRTNLLQTIVHPAMLEAMARGDEENPQDPWKNCGNPEDGTPPTPDTGDTPPLTPVSPSPDMDVTQSRYPSQSSYLDVALTGKSTVDNSESSRERSESVASRLPDGGKPPAPPLKPLKSAAAVAGEVNARLRARHLPLVKAGKAIQVPAWKPGDTGLVAKAIKQTGVQPSVELMIALRRKAAYHNRSAEHVAQAVASAYQRIAHDQAKWPKSSAWFTAVVENAFRPQV